MSVSETDSNGDARYPQREDRLNEEPSAKNAQSLFAPDACIFVGNLCTKIDTEQLTQDVKKHFSKFGACHVKIKLDKRKRLPGAFVQFEKVEDAQAALEHDKEQYLHSRLLRLEKAKGERTAILGLRSNLEIKPEEAQEILKKHGALQSCSFQEWPLGYNTSTTVCKATFAYVGDCHDAIKHFEKDEHYYMQRLDMEDNSNSAQGWSQGNNGRPYRPRTFSSSPPGNNGNTHHPRQNSNWRPRGPAARGGFPSRGAFPGRGGFASNRGNSRGFQRNSSYHQPHRSFGSDNGSQPMYPEALMDPQNSGSFPENFPPFGHPQVPMMPFNGPPGCMPAMQAQPPAHAYGPNYQGPLIVSSQPQYGAPVPQGGPMPPHGGMPPGITMQYYPNAYGPDQGYGPGPAGFYPPSFHPFNHGYYDNGYSQHAPRPEYPRQSYHARESASPPREEIEKVQADEGAGIEHLLEQESPEKAPQLIRVNGSDDECDPELEDSSETEGGHDLDQGEGNSTPKCRLSEVVAKTSSLDITKEDVDAAHTDAENETECSSPRASVTGSSSESDSAKHRRFIGYKSPIEDQEDKKSPMCSEASCREDEVDVPSELEPEPQAEPQPQPQPESSQASAEESAAVSTVSSDSGKETVVKSPPEKRWIETYVSIDEYRRLLKAEAVQKGWGHNEKIIEEAAQELFAEQEAYKEEKKMQLKAATEKGLPSSSQKPVFGSSAGGSRSGSRARSESI